GRVPGCVGGGGRGAWRDHVGVELLDAVGVGVAAAAGDGGDEASPGAGGDGVAGDAVTAEIAGDNAGEAGDGRLGGAVVGLAGVAPEAGLRAEVDDAAVALLSHEDGGRLDRGEVALEVHGHDLVPLLLAHVEDHAVAEDAGVVDEDIDPPEFVDCGLDDVLPAVHGRDGVVVCDCLVALGLDLGDDLVGGAVVVTG